MFLLAENMLIQIPGGLFSFSKAINLWQHERGFPVCDVETEMLQNDGPFKACCANNTFSPCVIELNL